MDSAIYTAALVRILANQDELLLTDHYEALTIGTDIYLPCTSMEFNLPEAVGDFSNSEGTIEKIRDDFPVLAKIAGGYPYNRVNITVTEVVLDDNFNEVSSNQLFDGLLYTSERGVSTGYITCTLRNWKYYTGITGGNPCTENCSVWHFGDEVCQVVVPTSDHQIIDIQEDVVTLAETPPGVDFLYRSGYLSLNGVNLKIRHWESGAVFQTKSPVPNEWLGQVVRVHAGCDRSLNTCRTIHNNEINFYGLGISMVDYNPQTERA